jgi:hypothetical protein
LRHRGETDVRTLDSVVINGAQADLLANTIAISRRDLGDLPPVVNLGATVLEVTSFRPTTIKANLPEDLAPGFIWVANQGSNTVSKL